MNSKINPLTPDPRKLEGLALSLRSDSSQRSSIGLRSGLCRTVRFFHTKLAHPCLYGPCFVLWCPVMLEQEGFIPKLFPQSWEHEIVQNLLVC